MDILSAYRDVGTYPGAAAVCGTTWKTVRRAVERHAGVADVAAVVAFAGKARLCVVARGADHSTYGQAQTAGGIVIDMAG
jgi:FAD/FMN-containing dehydrogenase